MSLSLSIPASKLLTMSTFLRHHSEGLITVLAGVLAVFAIADYPVTCKWLTEEEREWVAYRLATDGSSVGEGHEVKSK